MTQQLSHRASMLSLSSSHVKSRPRPSRNCSNCTCSPGLLSRNHRSTIIAKRMSLNRSSSAFGNGGGLTRSMSRTDSLCATSEPAQLSTDTNTSARLVALRKLMKAHEVEVYLVPSEDQHQSEYVSPADQKRAFISGFSGSAGVAIVTNDPLCMNDEPQGLSVLSTDGRYFVQAENELDFNWKLLKQQPGKQSWEQWTVAQAAEMARDSGRAIRIGFSGKVVSQVEFESLQSEVARELAKSENAKEKVVIKLVPLDVDLVEKIWDDFEPFVETSLSQVSVLPDSEAGESVASKLEKVRSIAGLKGSQSLVVSSLDEIAWLLNLRGSDIAYNPVFFSFVILSSKKCTLYWDSDRPDSDVVLKHLQSEKIESKPYTSFYSDLEKLDADSQHLLTMTSNCLMVKQVSTKSSYKLIESPIAHMKAVKNDVELQNMKSAHLKDGLALVKFFSWLENEVAIKEEMLSEFEAAQKQEAFREELDDFVGLSFETISSSGANAAVIHYSPSVENSAIINPNKIYLNDSGAQFTHGTTDVTRTLHFGQPSQEEIDNYTLVLKGNLALENLEFPKGTNGYMIDSIARQFLWSRGLDYAHGTSHGVGYYLNVHEGPIGIGFRKKYADYELKAGNVISNEPGYYKPGEYGIRIENVMAVVESENKGFLKFENMTKVPYCRKLINTSLLTLDEKEAINKYHSDLMQELKELKSDSTSWCWLKKECWPM